MDLKSVSDELKSALIKTAVSQALKMAVTKLPFLALPIINPIVAFVIQKLVEFLVAETALGLSLLWITLDMQYEVDSVEKARARLIDMLDNPVKYSEGEMLGIEEEFDEAALDLIQLSIRRL